MLVTTKWMAEKYAYFNSKYWNGQLPYISFSVNNSRKTWGFATYRYVLNQSRTRIETIKPISITLSNYYDSPEEIKETTLLHEMIHIADYMASRKYIDGLDEWKDSDNLTNDGK